MTIISKENKYKDNVMFCNICVSKHGSKWPWYDVHIINSLLTKFFWKKNTHEKLYYLLQNIFNVFVMWILLSENII